VNTTTPIVIFGLSRGIFHHGALGIARSAGRLGIPVHRIARERSAPARLSRYSRGWSCIPDRASTAEILEFLHECSSSVGRALLIPIDDAASVFVDEHAQALEPAFLFPRQPEGLAQALSSKREMYELCMKHGIPTPASAFPESEAELMQYAEQGAFPTVLKCINAGDAPPSAPRVAIVEDRDQLLAAYRRMESPQAPNLMIQEYVPGKPETIWMFNGYFDGQSACRVGFTGKKIRQTPPYTGATTLGVCLPNQTVEDATVRLMAAVGYRGILDIGYRFDQRDGQYKLLDVNPRIGGTFRLFVGENGLDVLRTMYLDLTGQEVPTTTLSEGRRWIVEPWDLASSLTYWRRGDITLGEWLRSLRHVREDAWFAADDPLPFLALWAGLALYWLPRRLLSRR
jgi:predicted ATP-grasp superfamily ATP-dependent carboligase